MPTKAKTQKTKTNRQTLIDYINRSKSPVAVYYEHCFFKTICSDETKLIGVYKPGTTIEDLKYDADVGGALSRRRMGKIVTTLRKLTESSKDRLVISILMDAADRIEKLSKEGSK